MTLKAQNHANKMLFYRRNFALCALSKHHITLFIIIFFLCSPISLGSFINFLEVNLSFSSVIFYYMKKKPFSSGLWISKREIKKHNFIAFSFFLFELKKIMLPDHQIEDGKRNETTKYAHFFLLHFALKRKSRIPFFFFMEKINLRPTTW